MKASVNLSQWRHHLDNELQRYIEDSVTSGMNPGIYTVNVRFVVHKDGGITDVRLLNNPGYGLCQGADVRLNNRLFIQAPIDFRFVWDEACSDPS